MSESQTMTVRQSEGVAHSDDARYTSLLSSGGREPPVCQPGVCSASERTVVLTCSKSPLALQNIVTANPSFSSLALRSTLEIPRSRSYVPRATTFSRARLKSAKPYVRSVNTSSEGRAGSERRGELLKRWAESVVRQLNTIKRQVEITRRGKANLPGS
jgi:hypothetical protein